MIDRLPQVPGQTPVPDEKTTPYAHPDEVLRDPTLSEAQKRAVLNKWTQDARIAARGEEHTPSWDPETLIRDIENAIAKLGPPSDA
ncbi:hypothetical protein HPQ64_09395 [Rhizobiales bacterium]|uniref:hypothetical protein n=1 Tax=Hongsoonwoonella zoysiae TaxID=2821844 RepID=UPI001560820E|nr:hypothetical protein [Hongsoonwoonella zoysiae]NRG17902.1 hypothetical protein [Hongsoonwoonella zoysiae]